MLLGDMIAKFTGAFGVKPCPPCKQRQAALNAWNARMLGQQPPQQAGSFVLEANNGQVVSSTRR